MVRFAFSPAMMRVSVADDDDMQVDMTLAVWPRTDDITATRARRIVFKVDIAIDHRRIRSQTWRTASWGSRTMRDSELAGWLVFTAGLAFFWLCLLRRLKTEK